MPRTKLLATLCAHPKTSAAAALGAVLAGAALTRWLLQLETQGDRRPADSKGEERPDPPRRRSRRQKRQAQPSAEAIEVAPARERSLEPAG